MEESQRFFETKSASNTGYGDDAWELPSEDQSETVLPSIDTEADFHQYHDAEASRSTQTCNQTRNQTPTQKPGQAPPHQPQPHQPPLTPLKFYMFPPGRLLNPFHRAQPFRPTPQPAHWPHSLDMGNPPGVGLKVWLKAYVEANRRIVSHLKDVTFSAGMAKQARVSGRMRDVAINILVECGLVDVRFVDSDP